MSKYQELKGRIEALNGETTLQEFGKLLLEVGISGKYLNMPTFIPSEVFDTSFEIINPSRKLEIEFGCSTPCDAIPALKKCFMWLLDNHPTIKNDHQPEIDTLKKQLSEAKGNISDIRKRLQELEG